MEKGRHHLLGIDGHRNGNPEGIPDGLVLPEKDLQHHAVDRVVHTVICEDPDRTAILPVAIDAALPEQRRAYAETLIVTETPGMAVWREKLFVLMARNAVRATAFFRLPPERVVELGVQVEI